MKTPLSATQIDQFQHGSLVFRKLASPEQCEALFAVIREHSQHAIPPVEYPSELDYPGAPAAMLRSTERL